MKKMAGTTFERNLVNLLDKKMINFEKYKNQKIYSVAKPIPSHEKPMLESYDVFLDRCTKRVESIEEKFASYSKIRKNSIILPLLKSLQNVFIMYHINACLFDKPVIQVQKKKFDKLLQRILNLMKKMDRSAMSIPYTWFHTQFLLSDQELRQFIEADDSLFDPKLFLKTS